MMSEEKRRGRRPIDIAAKRRHQELLKRFREALELRNEKDFIEAIRELGLADDPARLQKALKIWRFYS